jgi:7-keto-8-aminopelargonate synthetase-like enzyme
VGRVISSFWTGLPACLVDAARLSGARLRVFRHNDADDLERMLRWVGAQRAAAAAPDRGHALIVTESVFSMDGDRAPLREMVELKERHQAWLLVDEAHATGVLGPGRRGWIEELGLTDRVEVAMGTLGKALGVAGGFIAGSRTLVEFLVNRARSFVFSTAPPPRSRPRAGAAVAIVAGQEGAGLVSRIVGSDSRAAPGFGANGLAPAAAASPILR